MKPKFKSKGRSSSTGRKKNPGMRGKSSKSAVKNKYYLGGEMF